MNLEHLKLFVRVAATNNISKAGQELMLSPAVASSYINKLEEELNVRLVHRTTRKVSLTEEGVVFLPHAEDILASVEGAIAAIGSNDSVPKGTLRVTAPASFGRMHLVSGLKDFLALYPELSVDLSFSDSMVDIVGGGFDLAIRDASLKDSTLVARALAADKRIICASPAYIAAFGEPERPEDLKHHTCVILKGLENWTFTTVDGEVAVKVAGRVRCDNGDAMRDASVNGLGISLNSTWSVYQHLKEGSLVQVLKDYPLISGTSIWAVYPSSKQVSAKVKVFMDYYFAFFGSPPYWDA